MKRILTLCLSLFWCSVFLVPNACAQNPDTVFYHYSEDGVKNAIVKIIKSKKLGNPTFEDVYKEKLDAAFKEYWHNDSSESRYTNDALQRLKDDAGKVQSRYRILSTEITSMRNDSSSLAKNVLFQETEIQHKVDFWKRRKDSLTMILDSLVQIKSKEDSLENALNIKLTDLQSMAKSVEDSVAQFSGITEMIDKQKNQMLEVLMSLKDCISYVKGLSSLSSVNFEDINRSIIGFESIVPMSKNMPEKEYNESVIYAESLKKLKQLFNCAFNSVSQMKVAFNQQVNERLSKELSGMFDDGIRNDLNSSLIQEIDNILSALNMQSVCYRKVCLVFEDLKTNVGCVTEEYDREQIDVDNRDSIIEARNSSSVYYESLNNALDKIVNDLRVGSAFDVQNTNTETAFCAYLDAIRKTI